MRVRRSVAALTGVALLAAGCRAAGDSVEQPAPTESAADPAPSPSSASPQATGDEPSQATPDDADHADVTELALDLDVLTDDLTGPTAATAIAGDERIFVTERPGTVQTILPDGDVQPYLDLTAQVEFEESFEQGLLGIALHPQFTSNGRFYVYHSLPNNDTQLKEFRQSVDDPSVADPTTERVLLTVDKADEQRRHNGGRLEFGPDGMLWLSVGDGYEHERHPQDPSTLLGAILRIDVDGGDPYGIPPGNAFPDGGGAPEVWAYGLRNPWQFSIDPVDGNIWIGDVGHVVQEEINVRPIDEPGANFGWPIFEGTHVDERHETEDGVDYVEPLLTVVRESETACAIVAGPVYRGEAIPSLRGRFLHGDWCAGWVRSLRLEDGEAVDITDHSDDFALTQPSSFGLDADGEVLVTDVRAGIVGRIVADDA